MKDNWHVLTKDKDIKERNMNEESLRVTVVRGSNAEMINLVMSQKVSLAVSKMRCGKA